MTGLTLSIVENVGASLSPASVITGLEDTEVPEDLETGHGWSSGASTDNESHARDEALGSRAVKNCEIIDLWINGFFTNDGAFFRVLESYEITGVLCIFKQLGKFAVQTLNYYYSTPANVTP